MGAGNWYTNPRTGKMTYRSKYSKKKSKKSSGCYIATAVYGSYDCPEVWTLRRYRDHYLANSFLGRAFIRVYYFVSPTLVRLFGNKQWFTALFRGRLDSMVKKLNDKGYSSDSYNDPEGE